MQGGTHRAVINWPVGWMLNARRSALERSHREIHVRVLDRERHFVDADLACGQQVRVGLHARSLLCSNTTTCATPWIMESAAPEPSWRTR